jgi:succinate dehydrogenase / fumarate reductase cytochrome b subunit
MAGRNNNKRPVYLNLLRIHLPVGGVVSIAHRITGVLLVGSLPLMLLLLQQSLASTEDYQRVATLLQTLPARVLLLVLAVTLAHHFFAGVRHLLLDVDVGISHAGGRRSAWLVLAAVVAVGAIAAGRLFL